MVIREDDAPSSITHPDLYTVLGYQRFIEKKGKEEGEKEQARGALSIATALTVFARISVR